MFPAPAVKASLFWQKIAAKRTIESRIRATLEFMLIVFYGTDKKTDTASSGLNQGNAKLQALNVAFYAKYFRLVLLALLKHCTSDGLIAHTIVVMTFVWEKFFFRLRNLWDACWPTQLKLSFKIAPLRNYLKSRKYLTCILLCEVWLLVLMLALVCKKWKVWITKSNNIDMNEWMYSQTE